MALTDDDLEKIGKLIDGSIDPVVKRMDQFDKRFEQVDKRFDQMETTLKVATTDFQRMCQAGMEQVTRDVKDALKEGGQVDKQVLERHDSWIKETKEENLPDRVFALETAVKSNN